MTYSDSMIDFQTKRIVRRIFLAGLFSVSLLIFVPPAGAQTANRETEFFVFAEDIPLMQGMVELQDETMSFDKPEGRIIESFASMEGITKERATEYYKVILPQFGWGRVKDNSFYREKEYLELSFIERSGKTYLKVSVLPSL